MVRAEKTRFKPRFTKNAQLCLDLKFFYPILYAYPEGSPHLKMSLTCSSNELGTLSTVCHLFSATKHNSVYHPMTRLTCIATKYGNNHHSRTRLLTIDMNYTIFVHCHNLTGAANTVERYKLVSNFKEFLYFKSFYIFDFLLIKCVFFFQEPRRNYGKF